MYTANLLSFLLHSSTHCADHPGSPWGRDPGPDGRTVPGGRQHRPHLPLERRSSSSAGLLVAGARPDRRLLSGAARRLRAECPAPQEHSAEGSPHGKSSTAFGLLASNVVSHIYGLRTKRFLAQWLYAKPLTLLAISVATGISLETTYEVGLVLNPSYTEWSFSQVMVT